MPLTYRFYQDGQPVKIEKVESLAREISGNPEYFPLLFNTLTWLILAENSWEDILQNTDYDKTIVKLVRGLQERNITFSH